MESLNVVLINILVVLIMPGKLATLGLFKIKVLWNKGCDAIIFVHDFTNKILWCESNYIVDLTIWPKFGNSNISMIEVIIIATL